MDRETVRTIVRDYIQDGRHTDAVRMVKRYSREDEIFLDEIILGLLASVGKNWLGGCELVVEAIKLLPLGPSIPVRERVLKATVEIGFYKHAISVAQTHLHRKLNEQEVRSLIEKYANGAVESRTNEEELTALAEETGGEELRKWAVWQIANAHRRWED